MPGSMLKSLYFSFNLHNNPIRFKLDFVEIDWKSKGLSLLTQQSGAVWDSDPELSIALDLAAIQDIPATWMTPRLMS